MTRSLRTGEAQAQKMIKADMDLEKGLAEVAEDAAAPNTEGVSAAEALEKITLTIESGSSSSPGTLVS